MSVFVGFDKQGIFIAKTPSAEASTILTRGELTEND